MASTFEKYADEARKRLRSDGLLQFQDVETSSSARIRHLAHDVWTDKTLPPAAAPVSDALGMKPGSRVKFMIVGAGIGGIVSAVRLVLAGFPADNIRLVEAAGGVGGTWYWNRYPGLHCDIESYIYLPLLEEMGYVPSQKYVSGIEIRQYLQKIVEKYQLHDKISLGTKVDSLQWNENDRAWKAQFSASEKPIPGGDESEIHPWTAKAEFVILTSGYLARPQVPKLDGAGIEGFKGDMFHTARWNYEVTGGSAEQVFPALDKLRDKRVGIIGTGATAIQVVPCLAKYAKEVYVFQRTASAVYSRGQKDTDENDWTENIAHTPGWQSKRMENMVQQLTGGASSGSTNIVNDEWAKLPASAALFGDMKWASASPDQIADLTKYYLELDAPHSARLRARVAEIVKDEAEAKDLIPWYPVWCKRPTFSDSYLQTFNEPHVHLVDTVGRGIDKVTDKSIVVQDVEYPIDVLVLATGYVAPTVSGGDPGLRGGIKIMGREGQSIGEKWEAGHGVATLHGNATSGFPNLFWIGAIQGPTAANFTHVIDTQSRHIAYILATAHKKVGWDGVSPATIPRGLVVEVEPSAEEAWSLRIMSGAARFSILSTCTPGYLNNEGLGLRMASGLVQPPSQEDMMKMARAVPWSAGMPAFLEELERWRKDDTLSGYRVDVA